MAAPSSSPITAPCAPPSPSSENGSGPENALSITQTSQIDLKSPNRLLTEESGNRTKNPRKPTRIRNSSEEQILRNQLRTIVRHSCSSHTPLDIGFQYDHFA
ncbi:hypothetical protein H5410_060734 [Solanum commersonii]|uniref:Uncharacterized protein n=1 Tax=Solanum commersonii TaxID=4109 RepID=A0A9J5W700_SOLCO|nr:hypothetical protein H5410_060734 [Solanum commersonii]